MAFQQTVNKNLATGVIGGFYDNSLHHMRVYNLAADALVGAAVTSADGETCTPGGTGTFVGIIVDPKTYANRNGDLSNSLDVYANNPVTVADKGAFWVDLGGASNFGDQVYFDNTTGALGVGTAGAGQTQIPNCYVIEPSDADGFGAIYMK